jgi:hypothetical protein
MHICMYVCIYLYMYVCVYMHVCMCIYVCVCMYVWMMHVFVYVYIYNTISSFPVVTDIKGFSPLDFF